MLRLTLSTEEYLMLGDDIKIVFLGGSNNHLRIMVDAPKEVDIVRSKVLEKAHPEIREKRPQYYAEPELPERFHKTKGEAKYSDNNRWMCADRRAQGWHRHRIL